MFDARIRASAVVLTALFLVSSILAGDNAGTLEEYAGTPALAKIEKLTLVYPAAEGEQEVIHRLSAERRASYVRDQFGTEVTVVSDAELTDEQRAGHVLALGWDNALVRSGPLAPLLKSSKDGGRTFAGGIDVGPDEDLMFSVASPVAPGKRWVFWSRIDPELDRFSILPMMGSDWVVYRGYEVAQQGMMEDRTVWPPVPDEWAQGDFPNFRTLYPVQGRSTHFSIHYPKGALKNAERDAILAAREQALAIALQKLGKPNPPMSIDLYVFPDVATKLNATSVPDEVHSLVRDQELHMVSTYARTPNPHEEVHLVAHRLLGPTYHTALYEGLALSLAQADAGQRDITAAALLDRDSTPRIDDLLDEDRFRHLIETGLGYPAANLLLTWLVEQGGLELVGNIYSEMTLDTTQLARRMELAEADGAFAGWLGQLAKGGGTSYRFEQARAVAAAHSRSGDMIAAAVELKRALALRPGDVETLYRLAVVEMKAEQWDVAEAHLDEILAQADRVPQDSERYVVFAHFLRGRVYQLTDRADAARSEYRAMLARPDTNQSHDMARKALEDLSGNPAE